jgi:hypothetical protein
VSFGNVVQYCTYNTGFNELIVAALLTVTFVCAIVYMFAQFARRPEWEAWSKMQLYHVALSALLAGGAVAFSLAACSLSAEVAMNALHLSTPQDPFQLAQNHLGGMMMGNMRAAISQVISVQVTAEYFAATYVQLGGATFGQGFAPWPVYRIISGNAQLLSGMIIPFTSSIFAQMIGLQVVQAVAFTIVLPMGILLRAFTITRDAGSFMIAASIGLYIVLPLTYVMDRMMIEGPMVGDAGSLQAGPPAPPSSIDAPLCAGVSKGYDRSSDAGWYNVYPPTLTLFFERLPFAPQNMIAKALDCMAFVIPQAAFLPALNIIIVIAFVNSLTKFLIKSFG